MVAVGKAVALIDTTGNSSVPQPAPATEAKAPAQAEPAIAAKVAEPVLAQTQEYSSNGSDRFYSPLVMSIAREEKISMSELEKVPGSGKDQRVTKADILAYVQNRGSQPAAALATQPVVQSAPAAQPEAIKATAAPISVSGNVEIVEMDRMRKLIADHMVRSKHTSPHVTSFVEADVTELVLWRNKVKDGFQKREGEKLPLLQYLLRRWLKHLKSFRM